MQVRLLPFRAGVGKNQNYKMKIQLAVVVSDIHCGSVVGLAPPSVKTENGNTIGFGENHHQEWLWENWLEGIARVKSIVGTDAAALVVNGDATEGVHHRNESSLIAALIDTHVKMAHECLSPLAQICQKVFVVAGTECHTLGMENLLAEKLNAVESRAKDEWLFEINGCLVDAKHHTSVAGRAYLEASAMSIMMGNARVNRIRAGHRVPQVFLRAHRHCGGHFSDGAGLFCVTGAWQFLTRHGFKVVPDSVPRPSIIVLDWRGKPDGSLPTVHEITFNQPQASIYAA
jgi:hypothetical protein